MPAQAEKIPVADHCVSTIADDITQTAYWSWDRMFTMTRAEREDYQLKAARRRFDELAPRITALREQADQAGISKINTLNDLVPLLYNHTVFKSYPLSLLEKNRFDLLTRWFQRLTPIDLSGIDASQCDGIDDWLTLLETQTPLQIVHTTGTTGKLSFMPRTPLEGDLWAIIQIKTIRERFGNGPQDHVGEADVSLPMIYPSVRYGRYTTQRVLDYMAQHFCPAPDQLYALSYGTLSADLVSLSGRIRVAQAKGELAQMKLSDSQRVALKRYLAEVDRRPQEAADFFGRMANELKGKRVYINSQTSYLFQAATEGLKRGLRDVFSKDSIGIAGGGGKGIVLPPNYRDTIAEFTGIPRSHWAPNSYGMTELTGVIPGCIDDHAHLPPYLVPFLVNPETGAMLPREGRQTGRFAAFDLLAQNMWGGIITGDKVTIEWDRQCPCGRTGPHVHNSISRFDATVTGDDKVTCSATVDNTDAALQALLGR